MPRSAEIQEWLNKAGAALDARDDAALQVALAKARKGIDALRAGGAAGDLRASLGLLLRQSGACEKAIGEFQVAIEQQAAHYGETNWRVARSHRGRAMAFLSLRRPNEAIEDFEAVMRAEPDSELALLELGVAASILGHLYVQSGRGEKALPVLRRALETLPAEPKDFEVARNSAEDDLGYAFLLLDRLDAAEFFLERASTRAKEQHGAGSIEYFDRLWRLANLYGLQHRFAHGAECARQCVHIGSQLLSANDPKLGQAHLTLGGILNECEEWSEGRAHLHRAFQIMQASGVPAPAEYFLAYTGVIHAAIKMGELDTTEEDLTDLLEIAKALGPDSDRGIVQALVDLAWVKEQKGNREASCALAQRAHKAGADVRSSELARLAFLDLARLHVKQERPADAVTVLEWVAGIDRGLAQRLVDTYHFPHRILYSDDLAEVTSELIRLVLEHLPDSEDAARVVLRVVLSRKALLTEADIAHNGRARALNGLGVDEELARIKTLRAELRALHSEGPVDGHRKLWHALSAKNREIWEAESELAGRLDNQPAIYKVPDIDLKQLTKRLAPDEALLEFFAVRGPRTQKRIELFEPDLRSEVKPARYVVLVLHGGTGMVKLIDLGDAEPIERMVYSYIAAVHPSGAEEITRKRRETLEKGNEQTIGAHLRETLFDPIADHLEDVTRLAIAPDGAIAAVSFALLPLSGSARLLDRFEPCYLSCGRLLLRQAAPEKGPPSAPLIICDPDFDVVDLSAILAKSKSHPEFYFQRLASSAVEGERVAARVGGVPLTRDKATASALLAAKSPAVLHLATHGYFLPEFGRGANVVGRWRENGFFGLSLRGDVLAFAEEPLLRSGLAMAGVNAWSAGEPLPREMGDGLVAAVDVARLDLKSTDLVVLSACSAARGSVRPGEGSAGFLQAFEAAGASRVIAALWATADHPATVTLIDRFYAGVLVGNSIAAALRQAQREMKQLGAPPWVWGALVAYGDPSPIRWRPTNLRENRRAMQG
jgi:CHAT domain-containing protein/tetratricopeptide (TPR) repeat protein